MLLAAAPLILTGPANAGKSTIALAWARHQKLPTAAVDLDQLRLHLRSGWVDPLATSPPTPEAQRQWRVAVGIAVGMAARYWTEGYQCVVDAPGVYPDHEWEPFRLSTWRRELGSLPYRIIVLLPSWETVEARNNVRDPARRLRPDHLAMIYKAMAQWEGRPEADVLDTSQCTVEETVAAIDALLRAG